MSMVRGCTFFMIYGYGFQQFSAFSGFMGMAFLVIIHLLRSISEVPDLWV